MPINFLKQQKKQKYLIIVFIIIILSIVFIWWLNLREKKALSSVIFPDILRKQVEIDFELLKSSQVKELQPFQEIIPFTGQLGRNNPFLPN